jgi:pectin methylesterase-like acyl-CoA thioesterase
MKRYAPLMLLVAAACDAPGRIAAPLVPSADRIGRAGVTVHAGESIQAAVDAAGPGTVIQIEPGTYAEAIHIAARTECCCAAWTDFCCRASRPRTTESTGSFPCTHPTV